MNRSIMTVAVFVVLIVCGALWLALSQRPASTDIVASSTTTGTETKNTTVSTTPLTTMFEPAATITPPRTTGGVAQQKHSTAPLPLPPANTKKTYAIISYDGKNFSPREVTILKGGTVRFVNVSNEEMWIASNLHPIHSGYPEKSTKSCSGYVFDMCRSVTKGGFWEFTFDRQGTWGFHNHMKPVAKGAIEVNLADEKPSIPGH
jgi:plastocyanin